MKIFLSAVPLLLAFGACVWGFTPTPEQIEEWKETAANGDESAKKAKTTVAELMTKEQIANE